MRYGNIEILRDDTGEVLGFAADVLRDAGALDVFITPIQMKKNRPGQMLTCLCRPEQADGMAGLMLKHTTSWGIRRQYYDRYVLERHTEDWDSPYGMIRVRCGEGYGVKKWKPEYEDVETCDSHGLDVYLLEYTNSKTLKSKIKKYCRQKHFHYYISDSIELD